MGKRGSLNRSRELSSKLVLAMWVGRRGVAVTFPFEFGQSYSVLSFLLYLESFAVEPLIRHAVTFP